MITTMTSYVLIILYQVAYGYTAVEMQEFRTYETCLAAATAIKLKQDEDGYKFPRFICVMK